MDLSIRALRQLLAVAEEGSMSRAAARLNVAQPWLSARIRQIEDQWQLRLFDRHARGARLSRQGEAFVRQARRVVAEFDELAAMADTSTGVERLRIGAAPFTYFLPERSAILEGFGALHPNVSLLIENSIDPYLREGLELGRLDACFVIGEPATSHEALLVRENRLQLLVPAQHALASLATIDLAHLRDVEIEIFPPEANPVAWAATGARLAEAGALLVYTPEPMRKALVERASRSGRVAAVLGYIPAYDTDDPGMVRKSLSDRSLRADLYLVRLKDNRLRAPLHRFWDFARAQLEQLRPI